MTMDFTLLNENDLSKIHPLIESEFPYAEITMADLKKRFFSQRFLFFKIVYNKKLAGFSEVEVISKYKARINGFAVFKEFRDNGLGKALMKSTIESLKKTKIRELVLYVRRHNRIAVSIYKKLGFSLKYYDRMNDIEIYSLDFNQYSLAT